jgi:excisionase family DNA binding protein
MNEEERYQNLFEDVLLSKEEVSKIFRLSKAQISAMMRRGEIPYYKIGRKVLFSLKELKEWFRKHRRG